MSVDQLEAEILKLPRSIRARLAERLFSRLEDDSEIEEAWVAEAEQRYQRNLEGKGESASVEGVLTKLRPSAQTARTLFLACDINLISEFIILRHGQSNRS